MGHSVSLFAGPRAALRPFIEAVPAARIFALTPAAPLYVLPLTDDLHDALHTSYGTGEWIEVPGHDAGLALTSTDMVFAAAASRHSALAWLTTGYFGGAGEQAACAWIDGQLALKPAVLNSVDARPAHLRPINQALRLLGVKAGGASGGDEFATLGLPRYRTNDAIIERAFAIG